MQWGCGFLGDTFAEMIGALVFSSRAPDEGGGLVPTLIHMIVVLIRVRIALVLQFSVSWHPLRGESRKTQANAISLLSVPCPLITVIDM